MTVIVRVAADEARYDEWYDVYRTAEEHGRASYAAPWTRRELQVSLRTPLPQSEQRAYALLVDDRVVCAGWLLLHRGHNTDRAELGVWTRPDLFRRGLGSRMLTHLEAVCADEGRTVLGLPAAYPYASEEPTGAAADFARSHGYTLALAEVQRQLALPVSSSVLDALMPAIDGYQLREWTGPVPEELVEEWAELVASLETEAPTGDLAIEEFTADVDEVRAGEREALEQGRSSVSAVAVRADGRLAAYSQIYISAEGTTAYQWGTLVRREDRGHRLGMAVKVVNLRRLQREFPHLRAVATYNAASNSHMIAVNEALGFVPVEYEGEFQKTSRVGANVQKSPQGHDLTS